MNEIEKIIGKFNEEFKETSWYPNNWEPTENFIRKELSNLIAKKEREAKEKSLREILDGFVEAVLTDLEEQTQQWVLETGDHNVENFCVRVRNIQEVLLGAKEQYLSSQEDK